MHAPRARRRASPPRERASSPPRSRQDDPTARARPDDATLAACARALEDALATSEAQREEDFRLIDALASPVAMTCDGDLLESLATDETSAAVEALARALVSDERRERGRRGGGSGWRRRSVEGVRTSEKEDGGESGGADGGARGE